MATEFIQIEAKDAFLAEGVLHVDFYITNIELRGEAYHGVDLPLGDKTVAEVIDEYWPKARAELLAFVQAKHPGRYE